MRDGRLKFSAALHGRAEGCAAAAAATQWPVTGVGMRWALYTAATAEAKQSKPNTASPACLLPGNVLQLRLAVRQLDLPAQHARQPAALQRCGQHVCKGGVLADEREVGQAGRQHVAASRGGVGMGQGWPAHLACAAASCGCMRKGEGSVEGGTGATCPVSETQSTALRIVMYWAGSLPETMHGWRLAAKLA